MFFSRNKQKRKVIEQYGLNASSLLTMFVTYNRILSLKNEEQKEYSLKEFSVNISRKYGDELVSIFYKEFIPKKGSDILMQNYAFINTHIQPHFRSSKRYCVIILRVMEESIFLFFLHFENSVKL